MSLIVAKKILNEVFVISDTKFTYREPLSNVEKRFTKAEEYLGGLKTIILTPGICVSFAGEVEFAKEAFEQLLDREINIFDKNAVIDYFLDSNLQSEMLTDYIVVVNTGTMEIFKIQNGNVELADFAWIGDEDAFKCLQGTLLESISDIPSGDEHSEFEVISYDLNSPDEVVKEIKNYMKAFSNVIKSNISSVDGIRTLVRMVQNDAYYIEYLLVKGKAVKAQAGNGLYFGGAAEGSMSKHVAPRSCVGLSIFPLYFYTGEFGIIYSPLKNFTPELLDNIKIDEFKEAISERINELYQSMLEYQQKF